MRRGDLIVGHASLALLGVAALFAAGCADRTAATDPVPATAPAAPTPTTSATTAPTTAPTTTATSTTSLPPRLPTSTSTSTSTSIGSTSTPIASASTASTTAASTTAPSTTTPSTTTAPVIGYPALARAVDSLAAGNAAISVTVVRDGVTVFSRATGTTLGGDRVTTRTPLVIASVSKLITAISVARLAERGRLELDQPVPWTAMGLAHDPAWDTVTVRELLAHHSGMPIRRAGWLDDPGSCAIPLQSAIAEPPRASRGTWVYSNGNYCALGLLVEHVTHQRLDDAGRSLAMNSWLAGEAHLVSDVPRGDDGPFAPGVVRLERLGGAGAWMASSDAVAHMVADTTADDMHTLAWPGIMLDQYGWGHTGTVNGAKACAWTITDAHVVIVAIVAGDRPREGSQLCRRVVPALAGDLGMWRGDPKEVEPV